MTSSRAAHRRRRGFGTVVAILLLLLVAATLPVLASVFTADAKRTRAQADDAQLRQLLMAGAVFAKGQAPTITAVGSGAAAAPAPVDVPLPPELSDMGAKLTCTFNRVDADHVSAIVHARLPSRSMEQTVTFERHGGSDGTWHATHATLNHD